jgi:glycine cleavage system H protein
MEFPNELLYSKEHEWVRREEGNARIGITEFAQSELGDIVFVELPKVGDTIKANEVFGTVESVKTVSELFAPVSGKIIEVNQAVVDKPENITEAPYAAWMIVVEPAHEAEFDTLLTSGAYETHVS